MQPASHQYILDEIQALFNWNPSALSPDTSECPKVVLPASFYYEHLDERLSIKKTIHMPSLTLNLASAADQVLKEIKDHEIAFPSIEDSLFPASEYCASYTYNEPITNANSVAEAYQCTTARYCRIIASMLYLSPKSPMWETVIMWKQNGESSRDNPGLDESYVLQVDDTDDAVPDDVWNSIQEETLLTLRQACSKTPVLALWEIFAITSANEELLRTICESPLAHRSGETEAILDIDTPPDAMTSLWGVPMSSLRHKPLAVERPKSDDTNHLLRRSSRVQHRDVAGGAIRRFGTRKLEKIIHHKEDLHAITLPDRRYQTEAGEEPLSQSMLKHAWFRAVHSNSTFIIFHCGNFERIALRHRGSQTLYLSDLVDIPNCKDPAYGKLHTGLYMSIIHDTLDRTRQQVDVTQGKKRQRRKEVSNGPNPKRPKTRAAAAKSIADEIEHEISCDYLTNNSTRCDLLLLRICYGVYNSPSPSFFFRSGQPRGEKTTYESHQYLSVTLTSDIASGATGVVHGATLKFLSESGEVRSMSVVVKFAMKPHQQNKLRHEHSIYEQLALSRVRGVPRVFGLFEDWNSDVITLVMAHTGTSLTSLYPGKLQIVVEEPQRSAFIHVMTDIHRAGIRHRDIRPENLTIDEQGRVFIIDFDMAENSPTEGARSRELLHLTELLDGRYYPPHEFPSIRTPVFGDGTTDSGTTSRSDSPSGSHSTTDV